MSLLDPREKQCNSNDSVNRAEVDYMAKLVDLWWNVDGIAKMLHTFKQVRIPLVVDGLIETGRIENTKRGRSDVLKGVRILDVGCGGGIMVEDLAKLGATVVGIDPCEELILLARKHLETESPELADRIQYHIETVEEHVKVHGAIYDAIVCSEVMEHVDEKVPILEACAKSLKACGSMFVTTENQTLVAWFVYIIVPEYVLNFIPRLCHFYEKFISPAKISSMLSTFDCKTIRVKGYFYDRFDNSWTFVDDDRINYGLHAVKA
ncbi:ubiquinone biosynthesis O-methyltransferase, mitochondrial-like [Anopheles cruzii]|uniref:ubiquinone biosynthesis O-methyltransferase, mitochondrial-like n=1 Tax=Anopheles cruzii TaxID=68878 RepID=UPI0022EC3214|nr:ubiquinone biosynthesis O-methyltransferase, mitochondrial-like [Anopheles cruzii]